MDMADTLNRLKKDTASIDSSLPHRRPGCACDETGLCALHAEVHERLMDAFRSLDLAIVALLKDG